MDGIELGLNKFKEDSMTPFPRYLWTGKKSGCDSVFVAISRENNILTWLHMHPASLEGCEDRVVVVASSKEIHMGGR